MSVLGIAAAAEAGTGALLLAVPAPIVRLLIGSELGGGATAVARVAGIALIGLGVACLPGAGSARRGMLAYGILVTIYLAYHGLAHGPAGPLLWPAVALHVVLCLLLARRSSERRA